MATTQKVPVELRALGRWLAVARRERGFTQQQLAKKSGLTQPQLSIFEKGGALPSLPQLIQLARTLAVPLQWFLTGATTPGATISDIAIELQRLGVVDLLAPSSTVPGALRPVEEVIALAVSGNQPEPRIVDAVPAVLAWNRWSPALLRAYSRKHDRRTSNRLAWLADSALTIHRHNGFPGGLLRQRTLEAYVRQCGKRPPHEDDDLGRPAAGHALPPLWKRWRITYDARLDAFADRAKHLHSLRAPR